MWNNLRDKGISALQTYTKDFFDPAAQSKDKSPSHSQSSHKQAKSLAHCLRVVQEKVTASYRQSEEELQESLFQLSHQLQQREKAMQEADRNIDFLKSRLLENEQVIKGLQNRLEQLSLQLEFKNSALLQLSAIPTQTGLKLKELDKLNQRYQILERRCQQLQTSNQLLAKKNQIQSSNQSQLNKQVQSLRQATLRQSQQIQGLKNSFKQTVSYREESVRSQLQTFRRQAEENKERARAACQQVKQRNRYMQQLQQNLKKSHQFSASLKNKHRLQLQQLKESNNLLVKKIALLDKSHFPVRVPKNIQIASLRQMLLPILKSSSAEAKHQAFQSLLCAAEIRVQQDQSASQQDFIQKFYNYLKTSE